MKEMKRIPRILMTAPSSGSGKTLITCGILQALKDRGLSPVSFKCGPDYIDPMFHKTVLETPSRNLDSFFTGEETTRYLFARSAWGADVAVMEGAMGYYDGLGGVSLRASAYDIARITGTPAVLIVNCKGMSTSVLAVIKGFAAYQPDSRIEGVILNGISEALYGPLADLIRRECSLKPLGYVPRMDALAIENRHLGLVLPGEVENMREKIREFAALLERTLDLDGLLSIAGGAVPVEKKVPSRLEVLQEMSCLNTREGERPVIAVARDEAFCFLYEDNLELLERLGAKLISFSPLHDSTLPECDGLLLCGGYPELHLDKLSANKGMLAGIREALTEKKIPCMAECGGFMYLQQEMEDMEGKVYPAAGVLPGRAFATKKLTRFGYVTLTPNTPVSHEGKEKDFMAHGIEEIRAHEFHYFDTTCSGKDFHAKKPLRNSEWDCMVVNDHMIAGFPHLYYYSAPEIAWNFVRACGKKKNAARRKDMPC